MIAIDAGHLLLALLAVGLAAYAVGVASGLVWRGGGHDEG